MPTDWLDPGKDTVVLDYTDNIFIARGSSAVSRYVMMAKANDEASQNWFESGSMSYFHTRLHRGTQRDFSDEDEEIEYFVTSERPDHTREWRYCIRSFNWHTGRVATVGEHYHYLSFEDAWEVIEDGPRP